MPEEFEINTGKTSQDLIREKLERETNPDVIDILNQILAWPDPDYESLSAYRIIGACVLVKVKPTAADNWRVFFKIEETPAHTKNEIRVNLLFYNGRFFISKTSIQGEDLQEDSEGWYYFDIGLRQPSSATIRWEIERLSKNGSLCVLQKRGYTRAINE